MLPRNRQRLLDATVGMMRENSFTQPSRAKLGYGDGSGRIVKNQVERLAYIFYGDLAEQTDAPGEALFPSWDCGIPFMDDKTKEGLEIELRYPPGGSKPEIFKIHANGIRAGGGRTGSEELRDRALLPAIAQLDILRPVGSGTDAKIKEIFMFRNPFNGMADVAVNPSISLFDDIDALTSGQHQLAYLYFDPVTKLIERVLGSAATAANTLPSAASRAEFGIGAVLALMNSVPQGGIDVGALYLYYGQTSIVEADWYRGYSTRQILEPVQRHKLNATGAPSTGDDSADGYGVGSVWIDTTNDHAYVCMDNTASAAVWRQVDNATSTLGIYAVYQSTTAVPCGAGSETDLISHTIAAASLAVTGDHVTLRAAGVFASSVNTKRLRIKWGATTIFDSGALAITAAGSWEAEATITRTGAATQKCVGRLITSDAVLPSSTLYATAGETLSGTVALKMTGEAAGAADITEEFSIATVIRVA